MNHNKTPSQSIWYDPTDESIIRIIDQRYLPHRLVIEELGSVKDVVIAIREMWVRGAPLIGVTAAFGTYFAVRETISEEAGFDYLENLTLSLRESRPTAVNLEWAINQILSELRTADRSEWLSLSLNRARKILEEDIEICGNIGIHGLPILKEASESKQGKTLNVLTHCNAGWLACVRWGTATSPIYKASETGVNLHVWVDETRPRNQGARLTSWELKNAGIAHTVIADNTGGLLMQKGMVDICIVGSDRTTRTGDVANKIGTYLKALAAKDNNIPFYVALPSSTIDWEMTDGIEQIPIEERNESEIHFIQGLSDGEIKRVRVTPENVEAANYGFDITPSSLVSGLITEFGIFEANTNSLSKLHEMKFG